MKMIIYEVKALYYIMRRSKFEFAFFFLLLCTSIVSFIIFYAYILNLFEEQNLYTYSNRYIEMEIPIELNFKKLNAFYNQLQQEISLKEFGVSGMMQNHRNSVYLVMDELSHYGVYTEFTKEDITIGSDTLFYRSHLWIEEGSFDLEHLEIGGSTYKIESSIDIFREEFGMIDFIIKLKEESFHNIIPSKIHIILEKVPTTKMKSIIQEHGQRYIGSEVIFSRPFSDNAIRELRTKLATAIAMEILTFINMMMFVRFFLNIRKGELKLLKRCGASSYYDMKVMMGFVNLSVIFTSLLSLVLFNIISPLLNSSLPIKQLVVLDEVIILLIIIMVSNLSYFGYRVIGRGGKK